MSAQRKGKVSKDKVELLSMLQELDVSDETWSEIRSIIASFFASRATTEADKVAKEKNWTADDFQRMAKTHMRTSYKS